MNTAISQMDQVTQQNAASSEESASAAEELTGQAQELSSLVRQFRLRRDGASVQTATRPPMRAPAASSARKPMRGATTARKPAAPALDHRGAHPARALFPLDGDVALGDF